MKISANAGELAGALSAAAMALDPKASNLASLNMVHVATSSGEIKFTVNTIDRMIAVTTAVDVIEPGEAAPRAETFSDLVDRLPKEATVTVTAGDDSGSVVVSSGRARWRLSGVAVEGLPAAFALNEPVAAFELDPEDLSRLFEATVFASSTEETRYYMNGVHLHVINGMLRAVATDGHRLTFAELPLPAGAAEMPGITVPNKTVAAMIKLLARKPRPTTVSVRISEQLIEFLLPNLALAFTSRLIDGTFPDYLRVLPKATSNTVTVDRTELLAVLGRLEAVSDQMLKARAAGLQWNGADTLQLSLAREPHTADEVLAGEATGVGRVAASVPFLTEALLHALTGKYARIASPSPRDPIAITDPDDPALLAIVMPMIWDGLAA